MGRGQGCIASMLGRTTFKCSQGWWNEEVAVGAGWAGNLGTAGFKGEVTYFHPQEQWQDSLGALSSSISVDYVLPGNLFVMGGVLFNSLGGRQHAEFRSLGKLCHREYYSAQRKKPHAREVFGLILGFSTHHSADIGLFGGGFTHRE